MLKLRYWFSPFLTRYSERDYNDDGEEEERLKGTGSGEKEEAPIPASALSPEIQVCLIAAFSKLSLMKLSTFAGLREADL